jgi:hypothetical protein
MIDPFEGWPHARVTDVEKSGSSGPRYAFAATRGASSDTGNSQWIAAGLEPRAAIRLRCDAPTGGRDSWNPLFR